MKNITKNSMHIVLNKISSYKLAYMSTYVKYNNSLVFYNLFRNMYFDVLLTQGLNMYYEMYAI
jgi:hypothetical protein